jgi:transposase
MPKPLSMDLRERILQAVEAGLSRRAAADKFAVSPSCVIKLMQRHRADGTVAPRKFGGHLRPALEPHYARIGDLVAATPDITIDELRAQLAAEGIATSRSPLGRCLLALKLTRKKRPAMPPNRRARTSPRLATRGARTSRVCGRLASSLLTRHGPRPP